MTLTKTQTILGIGASAIIILAFISAGLLWAAETHFETKINHEASLDIKIAAAVVGFDKALNDQAKREIKREIRRLEYKKQKGIITDQELYELQGLYQELEEL